MIGYYSMAKQINQCFKVRKVTEAEHSALRALHNGDATEYQQRLALKYIVNSLSRAQDALYIPGSFDETSFLNGRAFVGQNILKLLNVPVGTYQDKAET